MKPPKNYKSDPSRWDSADPDTVTHLAQHSIDMDIAALNDWFMYCKSKYPSQFRHWTMTQFKNWNDQRIADLDIKLPAQTTAEALKEIEGRVSGMAGKWDPETKKLVFPVKPKRS